MTQQQRAARGEPLKKSWFGNWLPDPWSLGAASVALLVAAPLMVVLSHLGADGGDIWQHLVDTMLLDLVINTAVLLIGVLAGTLVLGVGLAWVVTRFDFPGRSWFQWAVILPFAFPTYVLGFVYLDLFSVSSPFQAFLKENLSPVFRGLQYVPLSAGVICVLVLAFYPYIYLMARTAFNNHGLRTLEVARSLGCSPTGAFFRGVLPLARPWIFGGALLVAMETLADFGTVAIFNYDTFTTAIYKAWYGFHSLEAAAQLAGILLIVALILLAIEQAVRSKRRYFDLSPENQPLPRQRLKGWRALAAVIGFSGLLAIALVLPALQLLRWSVARFAEEMNIQYWQWVKNTATVSLLGALLVCGVVLFLAYANRLKNTTWMKALTAFATTGYALPGAVLAVGVFIALSWLDNRIYDVSEAWLGIQPDTFFNGTVAMMLMAYVVRFLAVGRQPIFSSLEKVRPGLDEAAKTLGCSKWGILRKIHFPLLRSGMLTGLLLVIIDMVKEMPITLMTRPLNWDTLAVRVFELTSEGDFERAGLPSLLLVLAGLVPVILLIRFSDQPRGNAS